MGRSKKRYEKEEITSVREPLNLTKTDPCPLVGATQVMFICSWYLNSLGISSDHPLPFVTRCSVHLDENTINPLFDKVLLLYPIAMMLTPASLKEYRHMVAADEMIHYNLPVRAKK